MSETQAVYQNSQPPAAGESSSPTPAATGSTGAGRTKSANTSAAASPTKPKRKSTRNAAPTVEQALSSAQDIVRFAHRAGLHSHVVNMGNGDTAIVLCGVFYCPSCHKLSHGTMCQKCESQK